MPSVASVGANVVVAAMWAPHSISRVTGHPTAESRRVRRGWARSSEVGSGVRGIVASCDGSQDVLDRRLSTPQPLHALPGVAHYPKPRSPFSLTVQPKRVGTVLNRPGAAIFTTKLSKSGACDIVTSRLSDSASVCAFQTQTNANFVLIDSVGHRNGDIEIFLSYAISFFHIEKDRKEILMRPNSQK